MKDCLLKAVIKIYFLWLQCEEAEHTAMAVLKQEFIDDGDDLCSRPLSSMQKVPSISDLSDPESSLGKFKKQNITKF